MSTPWSTFITDFPNNTLLPDPKTYRSILSGLHYLTITRPDISYYVNWAYQKMHNPSHEDWQTLKHLLHYLKGSITLNLHLSHNSLLQLTAYSDADWASSKNDRRSTSGYLVYLGRNLISWSSKKHFIVSRSSTEAEYKVPANTAAEFIWLNSLLNEIQINPQGTPILYCDNLGATYLSVNPSSTLEQNTLRSIFTSFVKGSPPNNCKSDFFPALISSLTS
ncbi:unnamed protein product [Spirodela intermedia]|uniref:Uncharacterized protein n=1 Tax=Spirodela intermedia TaxID=51605 RepID=A0A7I8JSW7_SPIIN|nr:unnamed protein product [Spirodela intermedia]CAA6672841.1 unnamed protein product [Spirodela intermedia]